MGIMKRINLALTLGGKNLSRFAPGEREGIRALIRGSESLIRFMNEEAAPPPTAGGIQMDEVFLRVIFTGHKPERAGKYLVVDMVSETQRHVSVDRIREVWVVTVLGQSRQTNLDEFNRKMYRWFIFATLGQDDLLFIRKDLTPLALV